METSRKKLKNRFLCILRNIRNNQSKAWNKRNLNWQVLTNFFDLGGVTSYRWCDWLGIDPEGFTIEAKDGN